MSVTYSCDKCGGEIGHHQKIVRIIGSKKIDILCENCWEQIENQLIDKREVAGAVKE
jgi:hypothetical protein